MSCGQCESPAACAEQGYCEWTLCDIEVCDAQLREAITECSYEASMAPMQRKLERRLALEGVSGSVYRRKESAIRQYERQCGEIVLDDHREDQYVPYDIHLYT